MRRFITLLAALALLSISPCALAGELINVYIDKAAMLAHEEPAANLRIRPEGMVRVTRHSLWPWDEAGSAFSLLAEIENTSDEKIVIDEDWLIACRRNRDVIAQADFALDYTSRVIYPGERIVIHAGVKDWQAPVGYHDVTDFETVYGLSSFARSIRGADILRLRLETRGAQSSQELSRINVDGLAWIEDGVLYFEAVNNSEKPVAYHQIGVIVSDAQGRLIDVLSTSYARGAGIHPGETLSIEKPLQPYITEDMAAGASFELFAYTDDRLVLPEKAE